MVNPARAELEDTLRADVARLVQAMHHHLPARQVPGAAGPVAQQGTDEIIPLIEPVQHLADLLDAGASAEHLQEAALTVVDLYEGTSPEASGGSEGPVIDPAILAAVERLRVAVDALDLLNGEDQAEQDAN
jgi:hypothetical protein